MSIYTLEQEKADMYLDTMLVHNIQDGIKRRTQVGTPGKGMLKSSRDGTLRLSKKGLCVFCDTSVTSYKGSTGDHIIPTIEGGEDSADNWLPSCKSCDSSKGKKDMLQWWIFHKGRIVADLMRKDPAIMRSCV
jgi:5-methylcytosine-specific restriction endonuclease McrA